MHTKLEGANLVFSVPALVKCYEGDLGLDAQDWKALTRLSLSEAAIKSNLKNDFMASRCQCKTHCTRNSCRCKKRGTICTSKCHKGSECLNQPGQVAKLKQGSSKRDRKPEVCACMFACKVISLQLKIISRNWRSKGLRGIRSLRNSVSIENVWTHSENCI